MRLQARQAVLKQTQRNDLAGSSSNKAPIPRIKASECIQDVLSRGVRSALADVDISWSPLLLALPETWQLHCGSHLTCGVEVGPLGVASSYILYYILL